MPNGYDLMELVQRFEMNIRVHDERIVYLGFGPNVEDCLKHITDPYQKEGPITSINKNYIELLAKYAAQQIKAEPMKFEKGIFLNISNSNPKLAQSLIDIMRTMIKSGERVKVG